MKAVALTHYLPIDDPRSFLDVDMPKPEPLGHDILVSVKAVAVNPVDTKVRAGRGKEGVVEDHDRQTTNETMESQRYFECSCRI